MGSEGQLRLRGSSISSVTSTNTYTPHSYSLRIIPTATRAGTNAFPRVPVRRSDHGIRLHAIHGAGERPSRWMLLPDRRMTETSAGSIAGARGLVRLDHRGRDDVRNIRLQRVGLHDADHHDARRRHPRGPNRWSDRVLHGRRLSERQRELGHADGDVPGSGAVGRTESLGARRPAVASAGGPSPSRSRHPPRQPPSGATYYKFY